MTTQIDWDTVPDVLDGPQRDHFGVYRNGNDQPLIMPEDGGKRIPYQRTTNFIKHLDDGGEGLRIWLERHVLRGLRDSQELMTEWLNAETDAQLTDIATRAARFNGRDQRQEWGSMMHQITEAMDSGDMMPKQWWNQNTGETEDVPREAKRDADAYRLATRCLDHQIIEMMHVYDDYRVAGTPDRVSSYRVRGKAQGRPKIVDLKTGSLHVRSMEMQLAMYSRSTPYDVWDEKRLVPTPVDPKVGIIIHLPMQSASCQLVKADLTKGWADCKVARDKHQRGLRRKLEPLGAPVEAAPELTWPERIALCANVEALRDVWMEATDTGELTDDLKARCLGRKQELAPNSK